MPARATGERTRGSFRRTSRGSLGRRAVRVRERAYAARRRCPHGRPASEREAPSDVRRVARSDEGTYVGSPERPSWTYVDAFGNGPTWRGDDARTGDRTRGSFGRTPRGSLGRRDVRRRVRERAYAARRRCPYGRPNARLLRTYVAWLARTKGRTSTRSGTGLRGEETMPVRATERVD